MLRSDSFQITPEILSLIARIDEFKGAWRALGTLAPDRLSALRRVATIESIGSSTRIEGKSGPEPLPNLAIAKIIGCLAPGPNNSWNLTSATEPARTRQPDESTPEEIKEAAAAPLGGGTFQLRALDALDEGGIRGARFHLMKDRPGSEEYLSENLPKLLARDWVLDLHVDPPDFLDRKSTRLNSSHT